MNRRTHDSTPSGWGHGEKRRLLAGIETGVWSLAGACYRFGLNADEIVSWQRSLHGLSSASEHSGGHGRGLELYVELL